MKHRPIHTIAAEIQQKWPKVHYTAAPYLEAMRRLHTIDDHYGCDDARSVVLYFLSNARYWRGEDAKRLKAELKALL